MENNAANTKAILKVERPTPSLLSIALFAVSLGFLLNEILGVESSYEHLILHACIQVLGATLLFFCVAVLSVSALVTKINPYEKSWLVFSLLTAAFLDTVNAILPPSDVFVFIQSASLFLSGVLLCGVYSKKRFFAYHRSNMIYFSSLALFCAACLKYRAGLPHSLHGEHFTHFTAYLSLAGGITAWIAGIYFQRKYATPDTIAYRILTIYCSMTGLAGFLVMSSNLWNPMWWWWHCIRLAASFLVAGYFFKIALAQFEAVRELQQKSDAEKTFLSKILVNLPTMVFVKKASDLRFVLFNAEGERLLGMKESALIGKNDYDFFPKEQADFFTQKDREVLKSRAPLDIPEEPIDTPSGKRILHTRKIPTYDQDGKPQFLIGVSDDITEMKNQKRIIDEQQAALIQTSKLAALGEMAGGVGHEINNPLTILQGKLRSVKRNITQAQPDLSLVHSEVEKMEAVVTRIAKIVSGLKACSRDSEGTPFEIAAFSNVLEDTLILCRERFANNKVDLTVFTEGNFTINCRSIELSQVILNLLTNAFDAVCGTKNAWVKLETRIVAGGCEISVTDSGTGIPKEVAEKMFNPFYTTKEVGKGTGLGLSISKGVIKNHQGNLFLDQNCANTRFVFTLPIADFQTMKSAA